MTEDEHVAALRHLEILKWHILRADAQRAGIWARTAAALGADTLVVAGAALLLAGGDKAGTATRIAALAAMALVLVSAVWATTVLAVAGNWASSL